MTELAWHVGPLGSGKSGRLITTHNDFERQGLSTLVMKSAIDTKTGDLIGSRANEVRIEPDFLVPPDMTGEQLYDELLQREHHIWEHDFADLDKIARDLGSKALSSGLKHIFMDEAQFLDPKQVNALRLFASKRGIPVSCYGIATDSCTRPFPGSSRLNDLSNHIDVMHGVCRCGEKTQFNARLENGNFIFEGDPIAMDGQNNVTYQSLCGRCFLDEGGEAVLSLR